jgi:hypothetical protein
LQTFHKSKSKAVRGEADAPSRFYHSVEKVTDPCTNGMRWNCVASRMTAYFKPGLGSGVTKTKCNETVGVDTLNHIHVVLARRSHICRMPPLRLTPGLAVF